MAIKEGKKKTIIKFHTRKEFIAAIKRVENDLKQHGMVVGNPDIPYDTLEFCTFQTPLSTIEYRLEEIKDVKIVS